MKAVHLDLTEFEAIVIRDALETFDVKRIKPPVVLKGDKNRYENVAAILAKRIRNLQSEPE